MLETVLAFGNTRITVLGDVMLDRFITGDVERISPEAPIPVLRIDREEAMLGGAGNVAANIVRMGGRAILIAALGNDTAGNAVAEAATREPRLATSFVRDDAIRTAVKTRFVSQGQHLLRVDDERPKDVRGEAAGRLLSALETSLRQSKILVCSDYAKGVITDATVARAIDLARASGALVIVDPKGRDFKRYAGATLITPNAEEAAAATGIACDTDEGVATAAKAIADIVGCAAVVVTRGAKGLTLLTRKPGAADEVVHLPTHARAVHDVSGAGDTVIAVLALALGVDAPLESAARLANLAAGIAVGKVGTAPVEIAELVHAVHVSHLLVESAKVVDLEIAASFARTWRLQGKKVVFTNGCFDLLHPGHVRLLERARSEGDKLIVALNSDESVARLKGPARPIQNETARATVMASIGVVDLVTIFAEDTPVRAIEAIQPDILVKGADYTEAEVVGGDIIRARGGRVVLVPLEAGHSTTRTVQRVNSAKSSS